MTLLSAWALAGLLLSIPLVLVHMRRSRPPVREVSSLLPWRALASEVPSSNRRLGRPLLPLLLALQLIALILLVLSLARPASGLAAAGPGRIYVVDDSLWMGHREGGQERMAKARSELSRELRGLEAGTEVQIVLAGAMPELLYSGSPEGAGEAIRALAASSGQADLAGALRFAAGLRRSRSEPIFLLRAPEDEKPEVAASPGVFTDRPIGQAFPYQALVGSGARCDLPAQPDCEAFATVRNESAQTQTDRVSALEDGRVQEHVKVTVRAHSVEAVGFRTPAGRALTLRLGAGDAFGPESEAFIAVPSEGPVKVTLVGELPGSEALARALHADPRVAGSLRLLTPAQYRAPDAGETELLVLDHWLPPGGLPHSASLLLIAPEALPGGAVEGRLQETRLSGSDPASELLAGIDLESLTIDARGAKRVSLPSWMQAAAWSPEGPLLASGSLGGERVALLAFEPSSSNLPQLAALPVLIANLVDWSEDFAPSTIGVGEKVIVQQTSGISATTVSAVGGTKSLSLSPEPHDFSEPGLYSIGQRGAWGLRSRTIAVNASPSQSSPSAVVSLYGPPPAASARTQTPLWPWVLLGALLVLLLEWLYATRRRVRSALA